MASRRAERKYGSGHAATTLSKVLRIASTFVAAFVVVGCTGLAPSTRGAPPRMFPITEEVEFARSASDSAEYGKYVAATGQVKFNLRNQIVYARMYGIDQLYSDFEISLTTERQKVGFYSTIVNLGLTGTGAVIAGETTKSILAAAATGLTGAKEAYDSDILIAKTIDLLQQNMRANRKIVRAAIIERLSLPVQAYPLELALTDIENYYRAGTITSALIGVSENAGEKLGKAKKIEAAAIRVKFSKDTASHKVRSFLFSGPNGSLNARNAIFVKQWLARKNLNIQVTDFVFSPQYSTERIEFATENGLL